MRSAGFLIHSSDRFLLCHSTQLNGSFSRNDECWTVPKGIVENGDSLLETAYRETYEETSINIRTLESKSMVRVYSDIMLTYNTTKKKVHVFYVKANVDITNIPLKCLTNIDGRNLPENDSYCWVDWDTARRMVSKRQKNLFTVENFNRLVDV